MTLLNVNLNMIPPLVLGVGILVIFALLVRYVLERLSLPSIVGYLALGIGLAWLNGQWQLMDHESESVLEFLGALGVIVLLFRVGAESDLHELMDQLPRAAVVWLPNMLVSGIPAFYMTRYLLDYGIIPSLFIGVAMTATSVGVSVAVWEETKNLKSDEGELLLDTAELDDISGVALMALLFSIAPTLCQFAGHTSGAPYDGFLTEITTVTGLFLLKLFVFVGFIMMCGKYLEKPLSHSAEKLGSKPTVLVFVLGLGLVIAGAAGWVGLSLPIGALFAGLLVSRHREKYGIESFYQSIYALFVPFFFVNIGYKIDPTVLGGALGIGTVLAVVAILGKIIGTGIAAWRFTNLTGTILVGVSMVPRAEITMVVIEHGRQLGDWAVPADLYAAMVLVSATTCLGASVFLHWALRKWNRDSNT